MKTGLRLQRKFRIIWTFINFVRFRVRQYFFGFDVANQFLQRVDKLSMQLILKKTGATIGKNCDIETGLVFHNCKDYTNLIIGNNCHIGKNCFFDLREKVVIRDNVIISMQCTFITHLDLHKSELSIYFPATCKALTINENCYLGANSTVLMGITIEKNSFIAAASLVNKDVKKNTLVAGVPIKKIKTI